METNTLIPSLEALLFIYGEPLAVDKIVTLLGTREKEVTEENVRAAIAGLKAKLERDERALTLVQTEEKVQMVTKPAFAPLLEALVKEEFHEDLTPAALETLTIIAYAGPVSRSVVDYIRGGNSTFIMRVLAMRGLVDRLPDPKRPQAYLYRPSMELVRHVGLARIEDLPDYPRYRALVEKLKV